MTYIAMLRTGTKVKVTRERDIKAFREGASGKCWGAARVGMNLGGGVMLDTSSVVLFYPEGSDIVVEPGAEDTICEVAGDEEETDHIQPEGDAEPGPDGMDRRELYDACVAMGKEFDRPWNFQKKDELVKIYEELTK
ncbi:hypothetical protein Dalk_4560 [Desulfatibacillum aliphaticivorans]|uniref:Uncharacterized protein n=1 Tax=Desulfatibacillum aliphaticivorans TaxID=218208 RepID=B8FCS5_DESAL|nr:hypothetical protein [Desulfatibacillum aliphaticivorans]ACL06238.1 hypothetical protein Dalk_4560 [Desulfatibacillum aliphaticivorans]